MTEQNKARQRRPANWWLPLGLLLIALSLMLPHIFPPTRWSSPDWLDGVRGLVGGIGMGVELSFVIRMARMRSAVDEVKRF